MYAYDITRTKILTHGGKKNQQKEEKKNYPVKVLTLVLGKNQQKKEKRNYPVNRTMSYI